MYTIFPQFLTTSSPRHGNLWGTGGITPRIITLSTTWNCMANITSRQLYFRGKNPRYPSDKKLGALQCSCRGEERNFLPIPGIESCYLGHPVRSQSLHRLSYLYSLEVGTVTKLLDGRGIGVLLSTRGRQISLRYSVQNSCAVQWVPGAVPRNKAAGA